MSRSQRTWLGTSWKMNKTRNEAVNYLVELCDWARTSELDATVVVCPPFTALSSASDALSTHAAGGPSVQLGAQNMHWQESGAQTGEISAIMLRDCGVSVVELGHFERRQNFAETDHTVNLKVRAAEAAGLETIVCVGDSAVDREQGVAAEVVSRQVKVALHGLASQSLDSVVVAYEPGWAIGIGGAQATTDDVEEMHVVIRTAIRDSHGVAVADRVRVVYGGSVDEVSAAGYAAGTNVDGLFIGRAALTAAGFVSVIESFCSPTAVAAAGSRSVERTQA